jgi:hypothetical protein
MSSALGPTRMEIIQAVPPSHTGWTMRVRGRPSGPTVAMSHQTMRCARVMNSGSISANDETRIDLSKHVQAGKLRNRPAELEEPSRRDAVARVTQASPLLPFPNPTHQDRLTSINYELQSSRAGIERVPQAVAEQVEAEDGQGDGHAGNDGGPGRQLQEAIGGADHRAPARRGRLVAESEEG